MSFLAQEVFMDEPHDDDDAPGQSDRDASPECAKSEDGSIQAQIPSDAGGAEVQIPSDAGGTEVQFRQLVDSVLEYAIFLLNPQGNVSSWNKGAQRIKGYTADEIIGKHFSIFYTPEDIARDHPAHELKIARAEGRFEEEGWRVRKDKTYFIANVVISPIIDSEGVLRGYSKVTRDVTERRKAQEAHITQMRDQITRGFLREVLFSVTEGRLRFCETDKDLPETLRPCSQPDDFDRNSLARVRRVVRDAAVAAALPDERISDLLTGVGEATMNAAVHARHAQFQVCAGANGTVQVWVTDTGAGIKLGNLHRATLERGYTTEDSLGHGFWLMLHTCDRLWLLTGPEGTTVVLEQDRKTPEPIWIARMGTKKSPQP